MIQQIFREDPPIVNESYYKVRIKSRMAKFKLPRDM